MFCHTCLSSDRILSTPGEYYDVYTKICDISNENLSVPIYICWECKALLCRIKQFQINIKEAQRFISSYLSNTEMCCRSWQDESYIRQKQAELDSLKCLSTLSCVNKNTFDAQYHYTSDPLTEDNLELKLETKVIKNEINESANDAINNSDDDDGIDEGCEEIKVEYSASDHKDQIEIYVDNIKPVKHKKLHKVKPKIDSKTKKEIKEKFEEVVFTEEEMIRSREEKRNQPNYKKIPFKCDTCVLGFMRKENFEVHLKKKHDKSIGNHICSVCSIRFTNPRAVERHKRRHYIWYRCRLCRYDTGELWSAVNHSRLKHSDDTMNQIHCAQCHVVARSPEDLADHIKTEHTLYCDECGVKFKGKKTLRSHRMRIHAVKREFLCDLCKRTFMTKTRLESHMVTHNAAIAKKLSFCTICNVQYKNINVYRNHLKNSVNHSERLYSCPDCNKKFASKAYWTKHYKFYHLNKSQYHCDVCSKLFISEWRLNNHRQVHHNLNRTRDHPCNVCGKKFYTLSTLRGHKQTHSEQRSYMCEDCGDTFKQRPALYTHTKLVHKGGKRRK